MLIMTCVTHNTSSHSLPSVDHCVGNMMLPSVTVYGVRGTKYLYEWGPYFLVRSHLTHCVQVQYSITQVSNGIFTIKCRQSSSATATRLATSLTVACPFIPKKKSYGCFQPKSPILCN